LLGRIPVYAIGVAESALYGAANVARRMELR
jgi:hypothetical protein